jgi:hypothetical protein
VLPSRAAAIRNSNLRAFMGAIDQKLNAICGTGPGGDSIGSSKGVPV